MIEELPKRRRWLQFRLRTLLIAVLVLSLPLSWFAVRRERARRQRATIESLGGRVSYDSLYNVKDIRLERTEVADANLEHLRGATKLEVLVLADTQVTSRGVKSLQKSLPTCNIVY
jgi:hypothetical protein